MKRILVAYIMMASISMNLMGAEGGSKPQIKGWNLCRAVKVGGAGVLLYLSGLVGGSASEVEQARALGAEIVNDQTSWEKKVSAVNQVNELIGEVLRTSNYTLIDDVADSVPITEAMIVMHRNKVLTDGLAASAEFLGYVYRNRGDFNLARYWFERAEVLVLTDDTIEAERKNDYQKEMREHAESARSCMKCG